MCAITQDSTTLYSYAERDSYARSTQPGAAWISLGSLYFSLTDFCYRPLQLDLVRCESSSKLRTGRHSPSAVPDPEPPGSKPLSE